uniref:Secreted protein n=1 Tax=Schistosoma curassoni TaxID=6186 RepID=A0A183KFL3_9TREM
MYPSVHAKIACITKFLCTQFTLIWCFTCMNSYMSIKSTNMAKCFSTHFTFKWFFIIMYPHMIFRMDLKNHVCILNKQIVFHHEFVHENVDKFL